MRMRERALIDCPGFLIGAGVAGMGCGTLIGRAYTQSGNTADYTIRVAPCGAETIRRSHPQGQAAKPNEFAD
jgi:hypothetical protein